VSPSDKKDPRVTQSLQPTRRDRFLPAELLGISAGLAVFVGLIVLIATREFILAGVAFGITFIISLVLLALFALAFKPTKSEVQDIHEQDAEARAKAEGDDRPRGH
jgi:membrane protein implicated in regulation of membrane protease activity